MSASGILMTLPPRRRRNSLHRGPVPSRRGAVRRRATAGAGRFRWIFRRDWARAIEANRLPEPSRRERERSDKQIGTCRKSNAARGAVQCGEGRKGETGDEQKVFNPPRGEFVLHEIGRAHV